MKIQQFHHYHKKNHHDHNQVMVMNFYYFLVLIVELMVIYLEQIEVSSFLVIQMMFDFVSVEINIKTRFSKISSL